MIQPISNRLMRLFELWRSDMLAMLVLLMLPLLLAELIYRAPVRRPFPAEAFAVLPQEGLYAVEQFPGQDRSYLWTDGSATLVFPNPGGSIVLGMRMAGGPARAVPVAIQARGVTSPFVVRPELRIYHLVLPEQPSDVITVAIDSPTMPDMTVKRQLGVVVSDTLVSGGGRAPGYVLVTLALLTLGLYTLARLHTRIWLAACLVTLVQACGLVWLASGAWSTGYVIQIYVLVGALLSAIAVGCWVTLPHLAAPAREQPTTARRWLGVRWDDWLAVSVQMLAVISYFRPYLFTGKTLLPYDLLATVQPWLHRAQPVQNKLMGDVLFQYVPWRTLYRQALLSGEMPFWNPYTFGGMPFMANLQSGVFYPFNLLFLPGSIATGFLLFLSAHLLSAMLGMYILLRRFTLDSPAALVGALAWGLCGPMTIWLPWLIPAIIAWLPWSLLVTDWLFTGGGRRAIGALALMVGLTLLGGHPQFAYYNLLLTGLFAVWRVLMTEEPLRQGVRCFGQWCVGCGLGALIALPQLVPTIELALHNTRLVTSIRDMVNVALPLWQMTTLLIPEFYGVVNNYRGAGNFVESTGYAGLTVLIFAGLALLHPRLNRRSPIWFWLVVALLILHLVYGGVLNYALQYLPGYSSFRSLPRMYYMWALAVAGLAAWGVDAVLRVGGWRRTLIGGLAAGLLAGGLGLLWQVQGGFVALALPGWIDSAPSWNTKLAQLLVWVACLLAGMGAGLGLLLAARGRHSALVLALALPPALLVSADLAHFSQGYLPVVDATNGFTITPGIAYLQAHRADGRIARFGAGLFSPPLPANTSMIYGVDDVQGYDSFTLAQQNHMVGAIEQERFNEVGISNALSNFQHPKSLDSPLLNLLGVAFILSNQPLSPQIHLGERWVEVYHGPDMTIYRNQQVLPLAFTIGDVLVRASQRVQLAALTASDFDPARQAIVAQALDMPIDPLAHGSAQVVHRTLNTLDMDILVQAAEHKAVLLVIRQNTYPGWIAYVDGVETPIITTDYSMQGIVLTTGHHTVQLTYWPSYFSVTGIVACVALMGSVLLLFIKPVIPQ
jgi:hypothetical protein